MNKLRTPLPPTWTTVVVLLAAVPFAASLTFICAIGVGLLVFETVHTRFTEKYFHSGIYAFIYAALIFAASIIVRASQKRRLAVAAVVPATMAFMVALALIAMLIWKEFAELRVMEYVGMGAFVITLPGLALLHNSAFTCMFIRSRTLRVLVICICLLLWVSALPLMGATIAACVIERSWPLHLFGMPAIGFGFLIVLASAAMPALIRHSNAKWEAARESVSERSELAFNCPKCQASLRLRAGLRLCSSCGQHMHIKIEEPRCECGYLLYQLHSQTCPECGRDVPEEYQQLLQTDSRGLAPGDEAAEEHVPAPPTIQKSDSFEDVSRESLPGS